MVICLDIHVISVKKGETQETKNVHINGDHLYGNPDMSQHVSFVYVVYRSPFNTLCYL